MQEGAALILVDFIEKAPQLKYLDMRGEGPDSQNFVIAVEYPTKFIGPIQLKKVEKVDEEEATVDITAAGAMVVTAASDEPILSESPETNQTMIGEEDTSYTEGWITATKTIEDKMELVRHSYTRQNQIYIFKDMISKKSLLSANDAKKKSGVRTWKPNDPTVPEKKAQ